MPQMAHPPGKTSLRPRNASKLRPNSEITANRTGRNSCESANRKATAKKTDNSFDYVFGATPSVVRK